MKATNQIAASLAAAALLVALVVVVSLWSFRQIETAAEARTNTYDLIIRANALLSDLVDAETGQRGYALTGDEAFLDPYTPVHDSVAAIWLNCANAPCSMPRANTWTRRLRWWTPNWRKCRASSSCAATTAWLPQRRL